MKAIVIHAPHDIRLDDWPTEAPGPGQVTVRIAAEESAARTCTIITMAASARCGSSTQWC